MNIAQEFINHAEEQHKFRLGSTLASSLAGFVVGALGVALYFYLVMGKLLPLYCTGR